MQSPVQHPAESHQNSTATVLAIIGSILVIISVIALVFANWRSLDVWMRIAVIAAPMLLLYLAGFTSRGHDHRRTISSVAFFTANAVFPAWLGVFIYQTGIMPIIDGSFITLVAAATTLWYALQEFAFNLKENSLLTSLAFTVWLIALLDTLGMTTWINMLIVAVIGFIGLLASGSLRSTTLTRFQIQVYTGLSAIFFTFGSFFWPIYIGSDSYNLYQYEGIIHQLAFVAASAMILLALRSVHAAAKEHSDFTLYSLRGYLSVIFYLFLLIPTTIIALFSDVTTGAGFLELVIAVLANGSALLLANHVKLRALRILPSTVLLPLLGIKALVIAFSAIEITTPLLILVIGLLLFAVAFLISSRRLATAGFTTWLTSSPDQTLWGMGESNPLIQRASKANAVQFATGSAVTGTAGDGKIAFTEEHLANAQRSYNTGLIIALVIGGLAIFFAIFRIISGISNVTHVMNSSDSSYRCGQDGTLCPEEYYVDSDDYPTDNL